jgi:uncharacterized protein DUF397
MNATVDLSCAIWQKSTFSNGNGGNCVEAARNLPDIVPSATPRTRTARS